MDKRISMSNVLVISRFLESVLTVHGGEASLTISSRQRESESNAIKLGQGWIEGGE